MSKVCQILDHNLYTSYVCTFEKCQVKSRWNCAECFRSQIHKHNLKDYSHILPQKEILSRSEQQLQNISNIPQNHYELQIEKIVGTIENLQKYLHKLKISMKKLYKSRNMITTYNQMLQSLMRELEDPSGQIDNLTIKVISNPEQQYEQIINKYKRRLDQVNKIDYQSMFGQIKNLQYYITQMYKRQPDKQQLVKNQIIPEQPQQGILYIIPLMMIQIKFQSQNKVQVLKIQNNIIN